MSRKTASTAERRGRPPGGLPSVRSRAWLEWNGHSLLGQGRLALLESIEEHGSISAAARAMGVSYRTAWKWIETMNAAAGQALVDTVVGGRGGGGARLTRVGAALLEATRRLLARLAEFNEAVTLELAPLFELLGRPPRRRRSGGGRPARPLGSGAGLRNRRRR